VSFLDAMQYKDAETQNKYTKKTKSGLVAVYDLERRNGAGHNFVKNMYFLIIITDIEQYDVFAQIFSLESAFYTVPIPRRYNLLQFRGTYGAQNSCLKYRKLNVGMQFGSEKY